MGNETSSPSGGPGSGNDTVTLPSTAGDATYTNEEKKDDLPYKGRRGKNSPRRSNAPDRKMANGRDIWNSNAKSHVDDQVHVNLAMADLMAYLQVVANNSNQLPWTRRDDPDLEKSISELTSEDYARKSAAFIPADVRVLGGVFTRYGRVWDLPTSEEYNAVDGAHEPGRSYGGACANAFLKVVYDAASEIEDAAQTESAAASLFDDDEEEDEDLELTKNRIQSGMSLECAQPNPTTISWADLLRKMKAEMKEIEYAQYPKISTTRKIDLNKPFSLVPKDFDPEKGKKRSLLIGCNYNSIKDVKLKASHDDVRSMKDYIVNVHGFPESSDYMTVLLDDKEHQHPTFRNITEAFKALSEQSQPGDAVFVQFAGHGGRVLDSNVEEASYDEVIVPTDYEQSGLIRDTLIFKTLLAPMRFGVTVTIMMDTCDTGMIVDLPYSWSTKSDRAKSKLSVNDDFSFVRFLKVVKTLYDSSTFTQLGKTVGLALNEDDDEDDDDFPDESNSIPGQSDNEIVQDKSVFDILADACSPNNKKNSKGKEETLMDQFLNSCALLVEEEKDDKSRNDGDMTDEETQRTDGDGYSFDNEPYRSYDSYEDKGHKGRRRQQSRRK